MGLDPNLMVMMGLQGLGGAFSANAASNSRKDDRALQLEQLRQQWERGLLSDAQARQLGLLNAADNEAARNPFRDINSQAGTLNSLAMMRDARYTPPTIQAPAEMAKYVPQMSGGFNYTPNPEHTQALDMLYRSARAGQTTPTMTNPANYGKTGAINLDAAMQGLAAPGSPESYASGAPSAYDPSAWGPSYADLMTKATTDQATRAQQMAQQQKSGGGFWKKLAGLGLGIAAPFTGGILPAALLAAGGGALLGGKSGAVTGALSGALGARGVQTKMKAPNVTGLF